MKLSDIQLWIVLKIMNGAEIWHSMFTKEVDHRTIKAFKETFPQNEDQEFAYRKIEEMKVFYRTSMHVMLSVWLTAISLLISLVALLVSVLALIISLYTK